MQGLVVVGLIVEEIWNVDAKCVKVTGAQNIGQGHQVKVPAVRTLKSTMPGLVVVSLIVEVSNVNVQSVKVTAAQNIGQGYLVKVPAKSVHLGEALCKVSWLQAL